MSEKDIHDMTKAELVALVQKLNVQWETKLKAEEKRYSDDWKLINDERRERRAKIAELEAARCPLFDTQRLICKEGVEMPLGDGKGEQVPGHTTGVGGTGSARSARRLPAEVHHHRRCPPVPGLRRAAGGLPVCVHQARGGALHLAEPEPALH